MRKLFCLLLVLCLLLLPACSAAPKDTAASTGIPAITTPASSSGNTAAPLRVITSSVYPAVFSNPGQYYANWNFAPYENPENNGADAGMDYAPTVFITDFATNTQKPFEVSGSPLSFSPSSHYFLVPFIINNQLIVRSPEKIDSYNLDGSGHRTLWNNENALEHSLFTDEENLYFFSAEPSFALQDYPGLTPEKVEEEFGVSFMFPECTLYRLNLKTGENTSLKVFDYTHDVVCHAYDRKILFFKQEFSEEFYETQAILLEELQEKGQTVSSVVSSLNSEAGLWMLDIDTGEETLIDSSIKIHSLRNLFFYENKMYYSFFETPTVLHVLNLDTKKSEVLITLDSEMNISMVQGNNILLTSDMYVPSFQAYIFNTVTGLFSPFNLFYFIQYPETQGIFLVLPVAEFGDYYCVAYSPKTFPDVPDYIFWDIQGRKNLALIRKEDYWNSIPNYLPIIQIVTGNNDS